ncbi:spore germination protein (amino acid permease) [Tumebacillus sp. BK434]|uniref:GerAB/ArcD/ProY family transporter n=1 Tax=Tumebacillus sp. BK434 TaxID=2512169 RepID=UPI001049FC25|nr:endospore germination permease [Tumebacillus sp. BK434]TCP59209.1 spore germination protein (amino acid permease) [Tumebacillus sp. BK434]
MSQPKERISTLQMAMILISFVGISDHVVIIPVLLRTGGRDAWISVLAAALLMALWILLLHLIMKKSGQQHVVDWVQEKAGRLLSVPLTAILVLQMAIIAYITIQDTTTWLYLMYLYLTPRPILFILFTLLCVFQASFGIRAIAIANGILLPFVIVLGFFVMSANIPNKDYALLLPILENGPAPVLKGIVPAASGMFELILFMLLQHRIKKQVKKRALYLVGFFTVMLTLGPLTGAIAEFGPYEGGNLRYTASEEWRIVSLSRVFEHVDFLAVYQWMVGSFIRSSVAIFLIPELLRLPKPKQRKRAIWIIGALLIAVLFIPVEDDPLQRVIEHYLIPYNFWLALGVTAVLLPLCFVKRSKKGGETYQRS